jgi:Ca2+-transporting ATPase
MRTSTQTQRPVSEPWHCLSAEEVLARLGSTREGLGPVAAGALLSRVGPNRLRPPKKDSWFKEFGESLGEPLQLLLIAVAVLSLIFGELRDALAIIGVILLSAGVETASEMRAEKAIAQLKDLTAAHARVRRAGETLTVATDQLVPGDILVLEAGDIAAADARLIESRGLRMNESTLTGEAVSTAKSAKAVPASTDLSEQSSMVFSGTSAVDGSGLAVITSTGPWTEIGRLSTSVAQEREPKTELQRAMGELAKLVLVLAVIVSVAVPLIGIFVAGKSPQEMLLTGLTMAFATIPEELPILVTVLLAVGGLQLARQGALLRRLPVGETIGSVTHLLTDKTGTLTRNELALTSIQGDRAAVLAVALASQGGTGAAGTEPLDVALAGAAAADGITTRGRTLTGTWAFDADRKRVSRAWRDRNGHQLAVGGAPETVLALCEGDGTGDWADLAGRLAAEGHRVIAFATKDLSDDRFPEPFPEDVPADAVEHGLVMTGLAVFDDPLREGVRDAVTELGRAGVTTIVVTGDHPDTGRVVAVKAGLPAGPCLRGGRGLEAMGDEDIAAQLSNGTVIGRATPADKMRLVKILQDRGHVVAVTGDGVNDAPALAAANAGIAMGRRGTDLARQAAGLILTNDSYSTIVSAIEKGRSIASQLRRAVAFYLGAKIGLVLAMTTALLLGHDVPFAPVHIVLLELFMDIGASIAFVSEPKAPDAMTAPPRPRSARFVDRVFTRAMLTAGLTLALAVTPTYLLLASQGAPGPAARAGAVLAWLTGHTLIAWTLRARPLLSWRENPAFPLWALAAAATGLLLTMTPAAGLLGLAALSGSQAAAALAITCLAVLAAGALRILSRTGKEL